MRAIKLINTAIIALTLSAVLPAIPASANTLPKSYRGTWHAKPGYVWKTKHINKNMVEPRMKLVVHAKTIKWNWYGHLTKHDGRAYNRRVHTMRIGKKAGDAYTLRGHGPHDGMTYIYRFNAHKLQLAYEHGAETNFHR